MTQDQDATAAAATVADESGELWRELPGKVAGCFPRRETRQNAAEMAGGLLMELEDYSCWTVAEALGHCGPHRLQHLLSRASWDDQQVLERAAGWAAGRLDDGEAILIADETADAKSSAGAAGAARQYSGTLGGVALCQVAVTLTYATGRGHALIDRALYLPAACAADEEHRELAGIPDEVEFATKPHLAGDLLERAHARGIRAAFVTGDEVYGGRELRQAIRSRGIGYVLAVRASTTVTPCSGTTIAAAGAVELIPDRGWQRLRTGSGTKGVRRYDRAMLQITADDTPGGHDDGHSVLLIRRHRYTRTLSYYRCWTPGPVPLWRLIAVAQARWRIEEDHQLAKQVAGLDCGQVIRWRSWHRWSTICLLACTYLAVTAVTCQSGRISEPGLIPVTAPGLLRLLRGDIVPQPCRDPARRHHWSGRRRRHQYQARQARQRWNAYADTTT